MDLDTRLKSSKKQKALKIVPVLLSIVVCCLIVIQCIPIAQTVYVFRDNTFKSDKTVIDMSSFQNQLDDDYDEIVNNVVKDDVTKSVNKNRERCLAQALEDYQNAKQYYIDNEIEINKKIENWDFEYDTTVSYEHHLEFNGETVDFVKAYDFYDTEISIPIYTDLYDAKIKIQDSFDEHLAWNHDYNVINAPAFSSKTVKFYAKAKSGSVYTNVKDENELKQAINYNNGFTYENKEYSSSAIPTDYICESDYDSYLDKVYIMVEPKYENEDKYSQCLDVFDFTERNINPHVYAVVILLLILLALFIWSMTMAGRVEGGYAISKIDKIPNDIHFILSAVLIAVFVSIAILSGWESVARWLSYIRRQVIDSNIISRWLQVGSCASASLIYLSLLELCTSIARQVKAKTGYWKNTLIVKFVKSCIVNPIKKYKELKSFEPKAFEKRLISLCIAYFAINILLFIPIIVGIVSRALFVSILGAFILVGMNVASAVFVIQYIVNLDKIIYATQTRTIPQVDYNKLPKSLKLLVDSLRITQQELNDAVNKAISDERMRVELITNVSHDLKTPLTSIISYVDLLKGCDIENEDAKEYIGVLDEKSGRLKRLIDDLIEASKITSGVVTLNPVELNLSELATQAVVEHQQEFVDNDLELVFKGDKTNISAFADGSKTYRVIENLLSNARKYSAKGSRVYVDLYESNGFSVFEIKNMSAQPLNITPDELKERFVRGDKSRNEEGNGLGLSIADNLCIAMRGKMEIFIDGDLFKVRVTLPKK